ncbi:MAG TPA: hypothetical protein VE219_03530, partial [Candidatus Sulfotelmatobacter sp.]|nr:hypothetical protein [Candidatus Sulfotelmatobacter sp.]
MIRLWLVGSAVRSSPSPAMHLAALRACGIAGDYEIREVPPEGVPAVVECLRAGEARGCNVTMPYKATFSQACDVLEGDASSLRLVNTVTVEGAPPDVLHDPGPSDRRAPHVLIGDNTDARGFELSLLELELWPRSGAQGVVLGAGGAAGAVALALTRVPVGRLTLVARRLEAGRELAAKLQATTAIEVIPWSTAVTSPLAAADIVVNTTPAGLAAMPFSIDSLKPSCVVCDLRYHPRPVDIPAAAAAAGLRACD